MNKNKIKKTLPLLLMLAVLFVGVAGVSAYFMDGDTATNSVEVGGNTVDIVEEFDPPEEIEPGTAITKDVKIKNEGPNDCYVRVMAVFSDSDMEKHCTLEGLNKEDFVYDDTDGYYYYKKVLPSGSITPSLFTSVLVSESIPENEIKEFDIIVYAESYQSEGHDTYQSAWAEFKKNK